MATATIGERNDVRNNEICSRLDWKYCYDRNTASSFASSELRHERMDVSNFWEFDAPLNLGSDDDLLSPPTSPSDPLLSRVERRRLERAARRRRSTTHYTPNAGKRKQ